MPIRRECPLDICDLLRLPHPAHVAIGQMKRLRDLFLSDLVVQPMRAQATAARLPLAPSSCSLHFSFACARVIINLFQLACMKNKFE
jgi:hypothetical protein